MEKQNNQQQTEQLQNNQQQTEQPNQPQTEQQQNNQQNTTTFVNLDEINEILKQQQSQQFQLPETFNKQEEQQQKKQEDDIEIPLDLSIQELNKENVEKAIKQTYRKAVEDVYKIMPMVVSKIASELFPAMFIAHEFFEKHPELEKYASVVAHIASKIKQKEPTKSPREIIQIVEKEMTSMLELVNNTKNAVNTVNNSDNIQDSYQKRLLNDKPENIKNDIEKMLKLGF
mgnify:CR=1 FL=1